MPHGTVARRLADIIADTRSSESKRTLSAMSRVKIRLGEFTKYRQKSLNLCRCVLVWRCDVCQWRQCEKTKVIQFQKIRETSERQRSLRLISFISVSDSTVRDFEVYSLSCTFGSSSRRRTEEGKIRKSEPSEITGVRTAIAYTINAVVLLENKFGHIFISVDRRYSKGPDTRPPSGRHAERPPECPD